MNEKEKKKKKIMKGNTHLPKTRETNKLLSLANSSLNTNCTDPPDKNYNKQGHADLKASNRLNTATDNHESYLSKPPISSQ